MIVRPAVDRLLLVTQPDHAALAGAVMAAWRADGLPGHPERAELLLATREHDNGWLEPDAAPTVDPATGAPEDFLDAPVAVRQAVWPRGTARLAGAHPYAAALVAHHALSVYRRHRGDAAWQPFFAEMEDARRAALARVLPARRAGWPADYRFLFLGDLVSLVFCHGWTQPFEAEGYRLTLAGTTVEVTPDPFGGDEVPLAVAARRIAARRYENDRDLQRTLAAAPTVVLEGVLRGSPRDVECRMLNAEC